MMLRRPSPSRYVLPVFLACAALSGCGVAGETFPPEPDDWDKEVALPVAVDLNPDPRIVEIKIEARIGQAEFTPGVKTDVWTYNGTTPGPLIRAKVGDKLIVHFTNHLPEETTIHWHGLRLPNAMDGSESTQAPVAPGETFDYVFTFPDAGTFWYHPHIRSSEQVEKGLYGAIIVDDPEEPPFGHELVLVLDDILLDAEGALNPPEEETNLESYFGRQGNVLLVNGHASPKLQVRPGMPLRLRLIDAANARYFELGINGQHFDRIGGDGGLLEAPQALDTIVIAPGERADAVVTPAGDVGDQLVIKWLPFDRGSGTGLAEPRDLMRLDLAGEPVEEERPLPRHLRTIAPINTEAATEQQIQLTEEFPNGAAVMGINGHPFSETVPIEAWVGETQIWRVENTTMADHPFHLHGFRFQILDLDGEAPAYREWKDTFSVPAMKTARLAMTFDDRPGDWMFHCHILDHATLGMMGMLMVMK